MSRTCCWTGLETCPTGSAVFFTQTLGRVVTISRDVGEAYVFVRGLGCDMKLFDLYWRG
jgi:hypothetical protein